MVFLSADHILELNPSELSRELNVSGNEAVNIIQAIKGNNSSEESTEKSAYDLLKEEETETPIVTFCAALDEIIGGGIPIGKITEFCGAPGMGKTQFGMQLAVDAQIPDTFGGAEGEAVYIDCEGSFICERVVEIATAASVHIESIAENEEDQGNKEAFDKFSVESILNGIHVYRCHDNIQLIALSHTLPEFLQNHPKVKIIILDSIAFHFRHDFEDMGLRTRLLHGLVQSFMKMAYEHKLAVVFMNQMTTKISQNEESRLIPALGQSWGHACTIRIILDSKNGQRYARLFKSPNRQEATVSFDVTKDGIRDVIVCDDTIDRSSVSMEDSRMQLVPDAELPKKRQRTDS